MRVRHRVTTGWTPDHPVLQARAVGRRVRGRATPASALRRRSSGSSSRRSSRPTPARAASTAAPVWVWRSAANWPSCWAAKSGCSSAPGEGSTFTLYLPLDVRRAGTASRARPPRPTIGGRDRAVARPVADASQSWTIGTTVAGRATWPCSSSKTIRTMRACCWAWRATRASRASSPTAGTTALALARQYLPDGDHARHLPAGHAGLDGAQQSEARSGDAAHSGADHHRSKRSASTACRMARSPTWSNPRRPRIWKHAFDRIKTLRRARARSGCWSSRTTTSSAEHRRAAGARRHRDRGRRHRGRGAARCWLDRAFDCCVLDLRLPDMTGFELLERMQAEPACATCRSSSSRARISPPKRKPQLRTVAKSIVLKDVQSPERLLDETALFLHRVVADLLPEQAADARAAAQLERGPARPQGAGRGRRCPQHLRADTACWRTTRWRCSAPPTAARPSS